MNDIFTGELVRLSAVPSSEIARAYAEWNRDSEFKRLLDSDPARLYSARGIQAWLDKKLDPDNGNFYFFNICTLKESRLLGDVNLDLVNRYSREAFVGIMIGDRKDWNKGYGTDAMRVLLGYAFTELNLRRVSLTANGYNPRALRAYEKAGFKQEGQLREILLREGKRWDEITMGVLRDEWMVDRKK